MIPELQALDARPSVIRVPHQIDVPLTDRIKRLIDTPAFRRLANISQLGLVSLVYPGATHSRFEHSLGVYRNTLLFVRKLQQDANFVELVSEQDVEALVVAALLHDIGHWPYCHPIEDIGLKTITRHEDVAATILSGQQFTDLIDSDWSFDVSSLTRLIGNRPETDGEKVLCSIISGPIDVDKMDYLYRDSLHCGVPYGMNFDAPRLINSICLNGNQDGIAITPKGKTAAEMLVFARYVMFSEVYWHHAVRSATAMLQRAYYVFNLESENQISPTALSRLTDHSFTTTIAKAKSSGSAEPTHATDSADLINGLFGPRRELFKRVLDYNAHQNPEIYRQIAHQPYTKLVELGERISQELTRVSNQTIQPNEILIDAPPTGLEVQFKVEVNDGTNSDSLENISPVVNALAKQQFDDFVKRVRVFVHPRHRKTVDPKIVEESLRAILA